MAKSGRTPPTLSVTVDHSPLSLRTDPEGDPQEDRSEPGREALPRPKHYGPPRGQKTAVAGPRFHKLGPDFRAGFPTKLASNPAGFSPYLDHPESRRHPCDTSLSVTTSQAAEMLASQRFFIRHSRPFVTVSKFRESRRKQEL
jgi:hypothetical protein